MKTIADLVTVLKNGNNPVVEFGRAVEELDGYAEPGMRARATGVRVLDEEMVAIEFNFGEFEGHNTLLEASNYYDKSGNPTLTAHQSGFYKPEDDCFFSRDDLLENWLTIVADERISLFAQYVAAGTQESYIRWLEDKILSDASSK